ncbi:MFS transporter [Paenibacillus sp. 453mf]|uniref:MFS transporter n=1 Tax=Paenibacillus sp. 453mf TaxID=1761874 RepID=UPI0008F07A4D|nr:MFS transporter [Paenibacillus sp. 453mf]SFS72978.1 Major Facilitator Superfamily protein [Paenibacillus sp. 453mf]
MIMLPLMYSTVLIIIHPEKRGGAYGLIGMVLVVAPAIGPTISGLLLEKLGWNWIFALTLPVLVLSLVIGLRYLHNFSTIF